MHAFAGGRPVESNIVYSKKSSERNAGFPVKGRAASERERGRAMEVSNTVCTPLVKILDPPLQSLL